MIEPLGLVHTVTLPEDAIRFRVAFGHDTEGDEQRLARRWYFSRSTAPAGAICATAADVLAFARLHLAGGVAQDGARLLSEQAVAAMRQPQVEVPNPVASASHWGLGWMLFNWDGRAVFGHDGSTLGQAAFLRIVPDAGVAIALLTNGGHPKDLYHNLYRELLVELCDLAMPPPPAPAAEPPSVDVARHAGVYERLNVRIELQERDGELAGRVIQTGPIAALLPKSEQQIVLVPVDERRFVARLEDDETWAPVAFYQLPDGAPHVHAGGRTTPKIA